MADGRPTSLREQPALPQSACHDPEPGSCCGNQRLAVKYFRIRRSRSATIASRPDRTNRANRRLGIVTEVIRWPGQEVQNIQVGLSVVGRLPSSGTVPNEPVLIVRQPPGNVALLPMLLEGSVPPWLVVPSSLGPGAIEQARCFEAKPDRTADEAISTFMKPEDLM